MAEPTAPPDHSHLLAAVPFIFFPEKTAAVLLRSCRTLTRAAGELVVSAGAAPHELLIPLKGRLRRVTGEDVSGPGEDIAPREPIGLDCLLAGKNYPYSVVADEEATLAAIPWKELKGFIDQTPGLAAYLRLVADYAPVRELDQTLEELGCGPAFRAALLGALQLQSIDANTWLARRGDVPDHVIYPIQGTIQAYSQVGPSALKPLWIAPNNVWQFWAQCLERQALTYHLKASARVDAFKLSRETLESLRKRHPKDFEAFAKLATHAPIIEAQNEEKPEIVETLEDLFPPPPRPVRSFRLAYPFIHQNDEMDCGPACLAMVSKYHGNDLPIAFWRARMNVNQEGASLFDLASAAEKVGFVAHGLQIGVLADVEPSLFPLIALRRNHYVVLHKVDRKHVVLADPAIGIFRMDAEEFEEGFDGYVLMLKPTEQFYQAKAPASRYRHFWDLFKGHDFEMGIILATSLALTLLSMVPAFVSQFIIDQVLAKKDLQLLSFGLVAALVVAVMINVTSWLQSYYMAYLSSRFDFAAGSAFMRKLFSLPYQFFATRHVGDILHRLSEMSRVRGFVTRDLIGTLLSLLNLLVYSVALFLYSPQVALTVFISAPVLVAISILFSNRLMQYYNETFAAISEQDSLVAGQIKGMATIKTLGAEVASRWRFEEALIRSLRANYHFELTAATMGGVAGFISDIISYGVLGLAAYMAIRGQLTPGQVISVSILASGVVGPFHNLAGMWSEVLEVRAVLDRLNDVFLAESEYKTEKRALIKQRLRGEIEFRDVWFRYGGESSEWVLKGMSFRVLPGQSVAIVGPSGAGKSTLALLTARLYEPTKGAILIDGIDYRQYDRHWLRKQIGLLLQETNLFHGSLLENIAWGDARPDLNRVEAAAEIADAKDFILEKPSGYDYMITHDGLGLSGGQKQRISIARMLYMDPTILFMDEATSSLDVNSERTISKSLVSAARNRTVISIAHRYNTVKMSDFAMVVSDGQAVEFGTHDDLLRRGGQYARLFGGQIEA